MSEELIEAVARAILDARYQRDNARLNLNMTWDKIDENAHVVYMAQARSALAAIEASGTHVVVPAYPTSDMHDAAVPKRLYPRDTAMDEFRTWSGDAGNFAALYAAMLAARPKVTV